MKKIISVLALLAIVNLASCSGSQDVVDVSVTTAVRPLIPAAVASCLAVRTAKDTSSFPTADVTAAYFSIPQMTFTPQHQDRDVYISFIKITYTIPGGSPATCEVGGDSLLALKQSWYISTTKEARIAAGATGDDTKTECPIYCGGIDKDLPAFSSTATITVYGYEQNPNDANDAVGFTTTTYLNFGKQ
ncbi:MAG: hypothetical protein ACM3MG_10930 [Bacillota bacterium]